MGETVNMHVRDVPKEVKDKLTLLAAREHMSLNAFVVRLLEMESRFADNARLLSAAPDVDISSDAIVEAVRRARGVEGEQ